MKRDGGIYHGSGESSSLGRGASIGGWMKVLAGCGVAVGASIIAGLLCLPVRNGGGQ